MLTEGVFAAAVILAFLLGMLIGLGKREKPLMPVVPMVPYDVQKRKFEADQKALQDCLSYSIDVAYGIDAHE